MSKRAVILHGTSGSPTELPWQNWLRKQLELDGYDVYFPQLPDCDRPDLAKYDVFLKDSGWDFVDNVIIGHSSGATTALHLLQQQWFPRVEAVALIGTFLDETLLDAAAWYTPGQFDNLFVEEFVAEHIKTKAGAFYFVHGDDDPYCDYDKARQMCNKLDGVFLTLHGGGHIASSSRVRELPILTNRLRQDGYLG